MKTLPAARQVPQPALPTQASGPFQLASLEKLSDLTHRFQHLLRYRPKGMDRLLPYYHYFLRLKERLEHYGSRHQQASPVSACLAASAPQTRLLALSRLKDELAAFLGPSSPADLRKYSPALFLLFRELESLVQDAGSGLTETT